jgi:hypothetical protein
MNPLFPLSLDQSALYRIEVQGRLDAAYAGWLGDTTITVAEGENVVTTVIAGVADQAQLHGILQTLYTLGLPLLSLLRLE